MLEASAATAAASRSPARRICGPPSCGAPTPPLLVRALPLGLIYFIALIVMLAVGFSLVWIRARPAVLEAAAHGPLPFPVAAPR